MKYNNTITQQFHNSTNFSLTRQIPSHISPFGAIYLPALALSFGAASVALSYYHKQLQSVGTTFSSHRRKPCNSEHEVNYCPTCPTVRVRNGPLLGATKKVAPYKVRETDVWDGAISVQHKGEEVINTPPHNTHGDLDGSLGTSVRRRAD